MVSLISKLVLKYISKRFCFVYFNSDPLLWPKRLVKQWGDLAANDGFLAQRCWICVCAAEPGSG